MGLDMYLTAERYLGPYSAEGSEEIRLEIYRLLGIEGFTTGNVNGITINAEAAYWRKANAIHKWFVDNVQAGEDDCGTYDVNRVDLKTLLRACEQVLAVPSLAPELLPVQEGFFFGPCEYDDWYTENAQYTVAQLTKVIELPNTFSNFKYHSSW